MLFGQPPCFCFALGQSEQKQLTGDESIASFDGFFFGRLQEFDQIRPHLHLVLPRYLGQTGDGRFCSLKQSRYLNARTQQNGFGAIVLFEHGDQHMLRLDVSMVFAKSQRLSVRQGFLKFGGEFVNSHVYFSNACQLVLKVTFSSVPKLGTIA
jgi:hypothetical protein